MNKKNQILENRQYIIIDASKLNFVKFDELVGAARKNNDETEAIIKWDSQRNLSFTSRIPFIKGPYDNSEILNITSGSNWQYSGACASFNV